MGREVRDRSIDLCGVGSRGATHHVPRHLIPFPRRAAQRHHPSEIVARRTARPDDLLAGAVREPHVARGGTAASECAGRKQARRLHTAASRAQARREIANQRVQIFRSDLHPLLHDHPFHIFSPTDLAVAFDQERHGVVAGRRAHVVRHLPSFAGWQLGSAALRLDDAAGTHQQTRQPHKLSEHVHAPCVRCAAME